MRVPLRETGSILVHAPRDHVFEILRRHLATTPGPLRETPRERLEAGPRTFVLRDAPGGTRIIHAASRPATFLPGTGPRDALKAAVEAELLRVQRLVNDR